MKNKWDDRSFSVNKQQILPFAFMASSHCVPSSRDPNFWLTDLDDFMCVFMKLFVGGSMKLMHIQLHEHFPWNLDIDDQRVEMRIKEAMWKPVGKCQKHRSEWWTLNAVNVLIVTWVKGGLMVWWDGQIVGVKKCATKMKYQKHTKACPCAAVQVNGSNIYCCML